MNLSKSMLFSVLLLVSFHQLYGQGNGLSVGTAVGAGFLEGQIGQSIDGHVDYNHGRFSIGIFANLIGSVSDINPLPERSIITFTSQYFDTLEDFYHRSTHRNQFTVGLSLGYTIVNSKVLLINFTGGPTYNNYHSIDLIIDSSEPFVPLASYMQFRQKGFSYHLSNSIMVKISRQVRLGLTTRFIDFKDHNVAALASIQVSL